VSLPHVYSFVDVPVYVLYWRLKLNTVQYKIYRHGATHCSKPETKMKENARSQQRFCLFVPVTETFHRWPRDFAPV